ncbi:MAG: hypothetical protein ABI675_17415 [Chitinophagaceae bacterium]
MEHLSFLLFGLLAVSALHSQDCKALDRLQLASPVKFGAKVPPDIFTDCASNSKLGNLYYLDYDSLNKNCQKKYAGLFKFSSFKFPHVIITTNKKEEIFSVDYWSPLDDSAGKDSSRNSLPVKFTRIHDKIVSLYGKPSTIEDEKNADSILAKFYGLTRKLAWECNDIIVRMKVTYGSDIKVMNILTIHVKSAAFEIIEEEMLQ